MANENPMMTAPRVEPWREELRKSKSARERASIPRVEMPQLPPQQRISGNMEVNTGLSREQALLEATRCMD